ncbi:MAG: ATP synthase subunit I [Deltaproteobacteria bacterium]|nr:ATP synthase subunit I [Deltaproteobacteria bacterium]
MPQLHPIERLAIALVILSTVLALAFASTRFSLGVVTGGLLSVINFYILRTLMRELVRAEHPPKQAMLGILLMMKFAIMGVAIFLLINYAPLAPSGMLVGVSIVVLSIVVEGFRIALRGEALTTGASAHEQESRNG